MGGTPMIPIKRYFRYGWSREQELLLQIDNMEGDALLERCQERQRNIERDRPIVRKACEAPQMQSVKMDRETDAAWHSWVDRKIALALEQHTANMVAAVGDALGKKCKQLRDGL
jgi:hypothetical protein